MSCTPDNQFRNGLLDLRKQHNISVRECLLWVKLRNTHPEWMSSALPRTTDMRQLHRHDRFVP
jgi:hypothetical protein